MNLHTHTHTHQCIRFCASCIKFALMRAYRHPHRRTRQQDASTTIQAHIVCTFFFFICLNIVHFYIRNGLIFFILHIQWFRWADTYAFLPSCRIRTYEIMAGCDGGTNYLSRDTFADGTLKILERVLFSFLFLISSSLFVFFDTFIRYCWLGRYVIAAASIRHGAWCFIRKIM